MGARPRLAPLHLIRRDHAEALAAGRRVDVLRALALLQNAAVAPTVLSADDAVRHAALILRGRA